MRTIKKINKKPGFTAIELLFAMVVLGGMLTLTMTVIVGMLRFYVFANSVRTNQANGRDTLDSVNRDIRFGKLLTPTDSSPGPSSKVCIYQQSDNKIIIYKYGTDTKNTSNPIATDLYKKEYKYNSNIAPTTCDETDVDFTSLLTEEKLNKLNLSRMLVTKFDVTKTQGASFEVNQNAAAVIIDYEFLTGNANASGVACDSNNIFCSKLGYDTVINLRQGD